MFEPLAELRSICGVGQSRWSRLRRGLGPNGKLASAQLFKFEEQDTKGTYFVKESTKGEYVRVGHNDVIVRWEKGDGKTQIFKVS